MNGIDENSIWRPNATVAAVLENEGRFLLVEEETNDGLRFNQPAGHWEENETLVEAVVRETLEETAWLIEPTALIGVYRSYSPKNGITYLRFAFSGRLIRHEPGRALDHGILRADWFTPEEIAGFAARHRNALVQACIDDYRAGRRYPLDLLRHF
jgi:8-oxo-dGTP pyrophosphatase MutT (NUDIX family)